MFSCIWQWVYMGFCVNKMVNFNIKILLIISFININAYSQKLFIPLSDPEIISIYKKGEKDEDGSYISRDSLGNIRFYINGVADSSTQQASPTREISGTTYTIGARTGGGTYQYRGYIAAVGIWNDHDALSAANILAM